jgi:hypothetical protein
VTVRVKQNSPRLFPPSRPTRSISTKPGTASSRSAHVWIGIWPSTVTLVWCGSARAGASSLVYGPPAVDRCGTHPHQQLRLRVGDVQDPLSTQHRDKITGRRRQQLPCRAASKHGPAHHHGRLQGRRIHRLPSRTHRPRSWRLQRLSQSRPGMVPVPAGQAHQFGEDLALPTPV